MTDETIIEIVKLIRILTENAPWLLGLVIAIAGITASILIGNNSRRADDIGASVQRIIDSLQSGKERVETVERRLDESDDANRRIREVIERIKARADAVDNADDH